jgi:hypothetical protein
VTRERRNNFSNSVLEERRSAAARRSETRHDVDYRAELSSGSVVDTCDILNLSNGGSKLCIAQVLEQDEIVELRVGANRKIKARVAWAQTPYYGLTFDEEGNQWSKTQLKIDAYVAGEEIPEDEAPSDESFDN